MVPVPPGCYALSFCELIHAITDYIEQMFWLNLTHFTGHVHNHLHMKAAFYDKLKMVFPFSSEHVQV